MSPGIRPCAAGAFHHVISRGVNRGDIFRDESDRDYFCRKLARVVAESGARVHAWALLPNHYHLLLQTGDVPLASLMQRLGTIYARYFNSRFDRVGYLFEGRYKSIRVSDDEYFLQLLYYIHRNPIKAGLVRSVGALAGYPWSGHRALLGGPRWSFQSTELVLDRFGGVDHEARARLLSWMADEVVSEARDREAGHATRTGELTPLKSLVTRICRELEADPAAVALGVRTFRESQARAVISWLAQRHLALSFGEMERELGVSARGLRKAARRGAKIAREAGLVQLAPPGSVGAAILSQGALEEPTTPAELTNPVG